MENDEMKLADSVLARFVQIIQEAMLLGIDCVDIMRQVRIVPDASDPHVLVLSEAYQRDVKQMHDKLMAELNEKRAQEPSKLIVGGNHGDAN